MVLERWEERVRQFHQQGEAMRKVRRRRRQMREMEGRLRPDCPQV